MNGFCFGTRRALSPPLSYFDILNSTIVDRNSSTSFGVTTLGVTGKCLILPVTRYESFLDIATTRKTTSFGSVAFSLTATLCELIPIH